MKETQLHVAANVKHDNIIAIWPLFELVSDMYRL